MDTWQPAPADLAKAFNASALAMADSLRGLSDRLRPVTEALNQVQRNWPKPPAQ